MIWKSISVFLVSVITFRFFFFLHLEKKRFSGEKCSGIVKGSLQVSIPPFSVCLEKKSAVEASLGEEALRV